VQEPSAAAERDPGNQWTQDCVADQAGDRAEERQDGLFDSTEQQHLAAGGAGQSEGGQAVFAAFGRDSGGLADEAEQREQHQSDAEGNHEEQECHPAVQGGAVPGVEVVGVVGGSQAG
jgi:hypothetical protein